MSLTKLDDLYQLDELDLLRGKPIAFGDVCFIYPITMGEMADISQNKFKEYLSFLIGTPKEMYKLDEDIPAITFMVQVSARNDQIRTLMKNAFRLFIRQEVTPLPDLNAICVGDFADKRLLTEENFESFQYILKRMNNIPATPTHNNASSAHAQRIIDKINKSREIVNKIKAANHKDDDVIDLPVLISGLGWKMGLANVWNLSYYAFNDQAHRMQYEEEYKTNIQASMAGAKIPKGKLKYWIRPIQDTDKGGQ